MQANHMIEQAFEFVGEHEKYGTLTRLLEREMDGSRLLIFCETKRGCDSVTRQLRTEGWPALSIHGDKSQQERDWVLAVRPLLLLFPQVTCFICICSILAPQRAIVCAGCSDSGSLCICRNSKLAQALSCLPQMLLHVVSVCQSPYSSIHECANFVNLCLYISQWRNTSRFGYSSVSKLQNHEHQQGVILKLSPQLLIWHTSPWLPTTLFLALSLPLALLLAPQSISLDMQSLTKVVSMGGTNRNLQGGFI